MSEFNEGIYLAFALSAVGLNVLSSYFGWGVDDEDASRFTLWVRNRGPLAKGPIIGFLAGVVGGAGEMWVTEVLIPAYQTSPAELAIVVVLGLISCGFGLSAGKHITNEEYRFLQMP